jgi:tetratricopeptide (TPR) repeat protein
VWILIDNLERQLHRNGAFDNFELDALFSALPSRLLERKHPPRLRLISASALKPTLPRAEGLSMLLLKLDPLSDAEALKLLLKASGHSAPDDYAPLRLLVASVHGIPAAIIALSKIARSDKSSFAALLDDHQLDTARRALADDLQDGLRRVVDIAVGRVQGDTRALLNALAIFSGPVSGRILRATAGVGSSTAFRIALEEAVACQLLHVHDGAYELPGFLREPLRRMLPAESTHALHRRAADAVILGHEADPEAWNTRDHAEPFITRVEHLLAANDREQAQAALIEYQLDGFSRLGLYASAAELRLQLAELYRDSPASRASHLRSCAILLTYLGRYDEARVRLIEATELTQGDRRALSFCLNAQGILAYNQRRLRDARDLYRSSLELALELELDDNHIAVRHTNLAEVCANIGELEEGERHAHSALDLFRCASPRTTPLPWKSRYTGNIGVAWADLAKIHLARGELRQAAYHSDLAVSLARGEMHARRIGVALIIRGQIALAERRFAAACRCWSEAQACYHAIKSPRGLGRAHFYLGLGHHHAGELAEAERNYQESINLRHAESLFAANTYLALLNLARGPNAHDHALALARHSMSDCQRQIDAGHDFHDVYYALALAKLIEALLDPSQTAESRARDAYQAAWCTCSAAGIRAQALQTLELLPEPARERPLISAIQELLNTNTTEPATARPSPL